MGASHHLQHNLKCSPVPRATESLEGGLALQRAHRLGCHGAPPPSPCRHRLTPPGSVPSPPPALLWPVLTALPGGGTGPRGLGPVTRPPEASHKAVGFPPTDSGQPQQRGPRR